MDVLQKFIDWLPILLDATKVTVLLTLASVSCGLLLGVFVAIGEIQKFKLVRWFCKGYVFFFRGTPLLMQLFFIYYGLPYISDKLVIKDAFLAAFIAYSLNSAAYLAEIIRAAIQSIDKGQFEAGKSLGMTYGQTMKLVIIPQSIRRLIPPVGNEFNMVIKDTSLVSTIALMDLLKKTTQIMSSASTFLVFIPSACIYLVITAILTFVFHKLEKKFSVYE